MRTYLDQLQHNHATLMVRIDVPCIRDRRRGTVQCHGARRWQSELKLTLGDRATACLGAACETFENLAAWPELGQSAIFALPGTQLKQCFSGGVQL